MEQFVAGKRVSLEEMKNKERKSNRFSTVVAQRLLFHISITRRHATTPVFVLILCDVLQMGTKRRVTDVLVAVSLRFTVGNFVVERPKNRRSRKGRMRKTGIKKLTVTISFGVVWQSRALIYRGKIHHRCIFTRSPGPRFGTVDLSRLRVLHFQDVDKSPGHLLRKKSLPLCSWKKKLKLNVTSAFS